MNGIASQNASNPLSCCLRKSFLQNNLVRRPGGRFPRGTNQFQKHSTSRHKSLRHEDLLTECPLINDFAGYPV